MYKNSIYIVDLHINIPLISWLRDFYFYKDVIPDRCISKFERLYRYETARAGKKNAPASDPLEAELFGRKGSILKESSVNELYQSVQDKMWYFKVSAALYQKIVEVAVLSGSPPNH